MQGQYVLVRTKSAGVHLGRLESQAGQAVKLTNARRLWYWKGAFTLNEVATNGINFLASKLSASVPEILLTQAIEIIPVAEELVAKFEEAPSYVTG